MTTSLTATRASSQYTRALEIAGDHRDQAGRTPIGMARLPLLLAAAEYYAKAWGIADLMASTCPVREHGAWDAKRTRAHDGIRSCNLAITELVGLGVAS